MSNTIKEVLNEYAQDLSDAMSDDRGKDPTIKALAEIKRIIEEARPEDKIDLETYSNAKNVGEVRALALSQYHNNLLKVLG